MSDIVDRLRDPVMRLNMNPAKLMEEAAAEIERLEIKNKLLQQTLNNIYLTYLPD